MFYYLSGTVEIVEANLVVIDCGGVGFCVNTTTNTISHLKNGENCRLYTYCSIREDAFDIYGFYGRQELESFKLLISVTGVGPKAALAILSSVSPDGLSMAVLTQNDKMLTAAPGVGKKIAQRILLELKDKMKSVTEIDLSSGGNAVLSTPTAGGKLSEAIQALQVLGYDQTSIHTALKGIDSDALEVQDIIKMALKAMMKQ